MRDKILFKIFVVKGQKQQSRCWPHPCQQRSGFSRSTCCDPENNEAKGMKWGVPYFSISSKRLWTRLWRPISCTHSQMNTPLRTSCWRCTRTHTLLAPFTSSLCIGRFLWLFKKSESSAVQKLNFFFLFAHFSAQPPSSGVGREHMHSAWLAVFAQFEIMSCCFFFCHQMLKKKKCHPRWRRCSTVSFSYSFYFHVWSFCRSFSSVFGQDFIKYGS